ncbi:hypothetical protein QR97_39830 [Streptomyces sp. PBH53]|uniref:hypothetical protein n=1 Tax=Streptomyces sp. PBH53 TaxID=1577075 RepID=UPI0006555D08|nr:hypothetical protein [Streptomyces sp. PBH53]AKN75023.1 hypothetical protein QR97_39830 [Streptomyces sp. PBH53]
MTARRALGSGPHDTHSIRAPQADLIDSLPGIRMPDIADLRARGVLGPHPVTAPSPRRSLGAGAHAAEDSA